jgi:peptide/nickel transport system substrate-binding protein
MKNFRADIRLLQTIVCSSFSLFFLFSIFAFPGCSSKQQPQRGGAVIIGASGDFDSFNELNAADSDALQVIQHMLFMSLTTLDENLQFAPQLAASWEFSAGDTLLTFHLRKDVKWTDDVPTTARDVLFTYQLAIDTTVAYPAAGRFDQTRKVEVVDDHTVRFHFKRAYPDALFDTQMPILPKHILEKIPREKIAACEFNRKPVGNGPFKFVEWQANQRVVFAANPEHVFGRPKLDRVVFQIIPEPTVLLANLLTGAVDVVSSLSPLSLKQIEQDTSLQKLCYAGRNYAFIAWNNARPLFTKRVRQALTHAINKQEIIGTLLEGLAQPAIGPLLPLAWAYDKNLRDLSFAPEEAKQILAAEGWRDSDGDGVLDRQGRKFEFTIKTNADNQLRRDVAVMAQAQLKKLGIAAKVEAVEWSLLIKQVLEEKNFDAWISGWDAYFTVNPTDLWHSNAIANGYNIVSYRNARVDSLLEKGRTIVDRRAAAPLWREFQQIIVDEAPYTFLFVPEKLAAVNARVQNVKMDARSFLVNITQWNVKDE